MALYVRKYEFKPIDGGEIEGGHTVRSLCREISEPLSMTDLEVERVLKLALGDTVAIKDIGEFRRLR